MKGRLSRLKKLGLIKASEMRGQSERAESPGADAEPARAAGAASDGTDAASPKSQPRPPRRERPERRDFLPGWEKIASHTFTRTVETGFGTPDGSAARFESAHFAGQRARLRKGLGPAPSETVPYGELSFFDLETTGLSGGTGTVAFLAAIGYFAGGGFFVTQVFMDDFPGEASFLDFVVNTLAERPRLVTYNGAAFDVPLLRTRCIMNGIPAPEFGHIDALQAARRLWRRTLGSCSLQALEEAVLGESRLDDVPGFLIPGLWLEYSASAGAASAESLAAMEKVAEHNALDVKSLAKLFLRIDGIMEKPSERWAGEKVQARGLALELLAAGRREEGLAILEESGAGGDQRALRLLHRLYRRSGAPEECARIAGAMDKEDPENLVEMAKFLEHVGKDAAAALACTEKAIRIVAGYCGETNAGGGPATAGGGLGHGRGSLGAALESRRARLEARLSARQKSGGDACHENSRRKDAG